MTATVQPALSSTPSVLDVHPVYPHTPLRESALTVWRTVGKNPAAQAREMLRLRRSFGKLTPQEYYWYGLYDDSVLTPSEKQQFIGWRMARWMGTVFNDRRWWAVKGDKLVFHSLMQSYGLPVPKVKAVYHPFRNAQGAVSLRSKDELRAYLQTETNHPFFAKPVSGSRGLGLAHVIGYDSATDDLLTPHGQRLPMTRFIETVERHGRIGYMLQEVKGPHETLRAICGDRLATVRVSVLVNPSGPELFRAFWRIPAAGHIDDTYRREGNMAAAVDLQTGQVVRVVTGVGVKLRELERHPDTGGQIKGITIPHWSRLRELCLASATTMLGSRLQDWDIAVCDEGPVLIEADAGGSFGTIQLASGAGVLDAQFAAFLKANQFRTKGWSDRLVDRLLAFRNAFRRFKARF